MPATEAPRGAITQEGEKDMSEFVTKQIVAAQTLVAKLRERAEEGQGMVEYALILAFIAILVIVALKFLQPAISETLNHVSNSL
jgi:pilus assembly protein Flp/PilA